MSLKKFSIGIFFFISGLAFGQQANVQPEGIEANFSQESIAAYQESSQNKLIEFYEYLTLYSNEKDSELRKQIEQNIYSFVESENVQLIDFTNRDLGKISLTDLLSKIENENFRFSIESYNLPTETGFDQWVNSYKLIVKTINSSNEFNVEQQIKFEPVEKKFGSKSKTVWQMKLGNMSVE